MELTNQNKLKLNPRFGGNDSAFNLKEKLYGDLTRLHLDFGPLIVDLRKDVKACVQRICAQMKTFLNEKFMKQEYFLVGEQDRDILQEALTIFSESSEQKFKERTEMFFRFGPRKHHKHLDQHNLETYLLPQAVSKAVNDMLKNVEKQQLKTVKDLNDAVKGQVADVPDEVLAYLQKDLEALIRKLVSSVFKKCAVKNRTKSVATVTSVYHLVHDFLSDLSKKNSARGASGHKKVRMNLAKSFRNLAEEIQEQREKEIVNQGSDADQRQLQMGMNVGTFIKTTQIFYDLDSVFQEAAITAAIKSMRPQEKMFNIGTLSEKAQLQDLLSRDFGKGEKMQASEQVLRVHGFRLEDVTDDNMCCLRAVSHQLFGDDSEVLAHQLCVIAAKAITNTYTSSSERRKEFQSVMGNIAVEDYVTSMYHHKAESYEMCLQFLVQQLKGREGPISIVVHDMSAGVSHHIQKQPTQPNESSRGRSKKEIAYHIALTHVSDDGKRHYKSLVKIPAAVPQVEGLSSAGGVGASSSSELVRRRSRSRTPMNAPPPVTRQMSRDLSDGPKAALGSLDLSGEFRGTELFLSIDTNVFLEPGKPHDDLHFLLHGRPGCKNDGVVRIFVPQGVLSELDGHKGQVRTGSSERRDRAQRAISAIKWINEKKRLPPADKIQRQCVDMYALYRQRWVGHRQDVDLGQVHFAEDCCKEKPDLFIIVTADTNMTNFCNKVKCLKFKEVQEVLERTFGRSGVDIRKALLDKAKEIRR